MFLIFHDMLFFFFLATLGGLWNFLDQGSNLCPLQ